MNAIDKQQQQININTQVYMQTQWLFVDCFPLKMRFICMFVCEFAKSIDAISVFINPKHIQMHR